LLRNAQKYDLKKKSNKTTEGKKTKTEEKKAAFFVMSPTKSRIFSCFFTPLVTKRPKNALKKMD
jgi:hypothetical protein